MHNSFVLTTAPHRTWAYTAPDPDGHVSRSTTPVGGVAWGSSRVEGLRRREGGPVGRDRDGGLVRSRPGWSDEQNRPSGSTEKSVTRFVEERQRQTSKTNLLTFTVPRLLSARLSRHRPLLLETTRLVPLDLPSGSLMPLAKGGLSGWTGFLVDG